MRSYTTSDVSALLGMSRRRIREWARSGVLDHERGPGRQYRFGFQDLVLLRSAKALMEADVPQRRVLRALRRLKEQLPKDRSLTAVRIAVEGEDVVVFDEGRAWAPESGQLQLLFDVAELAAQVEPLDDRAVGAREAESPEQWLEVGLELEGHSPAQARKAYEKALELRPGHPDALVNIGRLYYEEGANEAAIVQYRRALQAASGLHSTAAFNLGLALEDVGRERAASEAYRAAILADPDFADAHYNLSRVYERLGDRMSALRHLKSYRTLVS